MQTSPAASSASRAVDMSAATGIAPCIRSNPAWTASSVRGLTPAAITTNSPCEPLFAGPYGRRAVGRLDPLHWSVEMQPDAILRQPGLEDSGRLLAEPGRIRRRLIGDQLDGVPSDPQRAGDLASDEARADHDHGSSVTHASGQLPDMIEGTDHQDPRMISARNRKPRRLCPGGEQAPHIAKLASSGQGGDASLGIERYDPTRDQVDAFLLEPRLGLDRQLALGAFAAQQILGERRSFVRDPVLVGDDRDIPPPPTSR